jgi:hypothetical protein
MNTTTLGADTATDELPDLLRELAKASVGACNCGAKTPLHGAHNYACRYRVIEEARVRLAAGAPVQQSQQWPFAETPGEFAARLDAALMTFGRNTLAAVRNVLIENPPTFAAPLQVSGATSGAQRGYKWLPIHATNEMVRAAYSFDTKTCIWEAMVAASPEIAAPAGAVVARPDLSKLTCWSYNPKRGLFRHPEGDMFMIEEVEALFAPQAPDQTTGEKK